MFDYDRLRNKILKERKDNPSILAEISDNADLTQIEKQDLKDLVHDG
ncbi:hypothetical protein GF325_09925 [Candidatus Bathyarchaeota archaeon]|nr:hypothetical protein [Candidatus Bathyarchaeota archaeon]